METSGLIEHKMESQRAELTGSPKTEKARFGLQAMGDWHGSKATGGKKSAKTGISPDTWRRPSFWIERERCGWPRRTLWSFCLRAPRRFKRPADLSVRFIRSARRPTANCGWP